VTGGQGACAQTATGAAVSPPAASTTQPSLILNSQINSGDTAWMLASMALVLMMTVPGLALFYGGMVRKKNVLATLMQSFAITCLVTILWYVIGYSLAFTPGTPYVGGLSRLFMNGVIYIKDVAAVAATKDK
jgi:Amt family ammonium transporter